MNSIRGDSVILQRLLIALDCPTEHAQRITDRCSRLFHERLRDMILEAVSRAHRSHGLPLAIDKLVIELGDIPLAEFERVFLRKLAEQLQLQLGEYDAAGSERASMPFEPGGVPAVIALPTGGISSAISSADQACMLDHYLQAGYWPSLPQSPCSLLGGDGGPNAWVMSQLMSQHATDALPWQALIARACLSQKSRRRLMRLLSADTLQHCLQVVGPITAPAALLAALRFFQRHSEQYLPLPKPDDDIPAIPVTTDNETQLELLLSGAAPPSLTIWLDALRRHPPLRSWLQKRHWVHECRVVNSSRIDSSDSTASRKIMQKEQEAERTPTVTGRQVLSTTHKPSSQSVSQTGHAPASTLAADNAGLVLLWPLLPDLFTRLGLWQHDHFIDVTAQINAACWLDAAIWTDDCAKEWRMPFTKYLCGLPLETEVVWQPPSDDVADCLQSWWQPLPLQLPGWRTLGVADIRSLFIQRPGVLDQFDTEPILHVQREPFDILLNDWPWPVDVLMLPWLERPLSIHWL